MAEYTVEYGVQIFYYNEIYFLHFSLQHTGFANGLARQFEVSNAWQSFWLKFRHATLQLIFLFCFVLFLFCFLAVQLKIDELSTKSCFAWYFTCFMAMCRRLGISDSANYRTAFVLIAMCFSSCAIFLDNHVCMLY